MDNPNACSLRNYLKPWPLAQTKVSLNKTERYCCEKSYPSTHKSHFLSQIRDALITLSCQNASKLLSAFNVSYALVYRIERDSGKDHSLFLLSIVVGSSCFPFMVHQSIHEPSSSHILGPEFKSQQRNAPIRVSATLNHRMQQMPTRLVRSLFILFTYHMSSESISYIFNISLSQKTISNMDFLYMLRNFGFSRETFFLCTEWHGRW